MDPCLPDLFTVLYPPMPGVIMMTAMFALFVVELSLNSKLGGHSHSHGRPLGYDARPPCLGPPSRPPRHSEYRSSFNADDIDFEKQVANEMYDEKRRYIYQQNPALDGTEMNTESEMPAWFI